jgi:two-component system chemotaxis response regulator CheY
MMNMADVLVVDDNPEMRGVLVRLLRYAGHAADGVESGSAALHRLRAGPPALVILDYTMPDMDGLTVLRTVRSDPSLARVPVLMFSAVGDQEKQDEAARLGAAGWLVKGAVTFPNVLAAVAECVGRAA